MIGGRVTEPMDVRGFANLVFDLAPINSDSSINTILKNSFHSFLSCHFQKGKQTRTSIFIR